MILYIKKKTIKVGRGYWIMHILSNLFLFTLKKRAFWIIEPWNLLLLVTTSLMKKHDITTLLKTSNDHKSIDPYSPTFQVYYSKLNCLIICHTILKIYCFSQIKN